VAKKRRVGSKAGVQAALSTGSNDPPPSGAGSSSTSLSLTITINPEPVTVVPTPYPADPTGPLVVPDYLRVDTTSKEFREFNKRLDKIIELLAKSNAIAGDTRQQLIADIKAGREILASPRPNRALVALLLERPLKFIAEAVAAGLIADQTIQALHYLQHLFEAGIPL
jgi:hypothetical protein